MPILFPKTRDENGTHGFVSLWDDSITIFQIFQNINRDPPGTKNDNSMDIFCEGGYQETLG